MTFTIYLIPALMTVIIVTALIRKVPVYDVFIDGVEDGLKIVLGIFPTMLAILTAVAMLRASGTIDLLISFLAPVTNALHIPEEVMPLAMIRPISGSGALGVLTDTLRTYGPDSSTGRIASVIMGSTETTFYTLCVYFASTKVKYTKKAIPCALIGDFVGLLASVYICHAWFGS